MVHNKTRKEGNKGMEEGISIHSINMLSLDDNLLVERQASPRFVLGEARWVDVFDNVVEHSLGQVVDQGELVLDNLAHFYVDFQNPEIDTSVLL